MTGWGLTSAFYNLLDMIQIILEAESWLSGSEKPDIPVLSEE
jgi:hypothetical protein